ncbi:recombinase RecQ, partial [Micrococcus sp. SIMBA_144]
RRPSPAARLAWLLDHLSDLPGSGIVYARTVAAAEDTARALREAGHEGGAAPARADPERRAATEEDLEANRAKPVAA